MAQTCMFCNTAIKGERTLCPNCEQWLLARRGGESTITDYGYDGGTLNEADIQRQLNISRWEAHKIVQAFGFHGKHLRGISRREFVYRKLNGDITRALAAPMSTPGSITRAIHLLEANGYKVIKEI